MFAISNFIERIIAFIILIFISPLLILISIIIKLDSKGSILFTQDRVGKDGQIFTIYKFRTLKQDAPSNIPSINLEYSYLTKCGKYLRKSSLDELPQILNIIRGDMSFIGYRPVIKEEEKLIELRKKHKIDTKLPGLTGWAQINGRDYVSLKEKIQFEEYYNLNGSFTFDLYILFMTVINLFTQKGIRC